MQEKSCRFPSMIRRCCCPTFSHASIAFIIAATVLQHCSGGSRVPTSRTHPWTSHLHLHHIWPGQLEIQPWEMAVCIQHPERPASAWWLVDFLVLGSFFPLAKQQVSVAREAGRGPSAQMELSSITDRVCSEHWMCNTLSCHHHPALCRWAGCDEVFPPTNLIRANCLTSD